MKVILSIEGMSCSACSSALEKYLNKNIGIYKGKVENIVLRLYTLSINRRRDKKSIRK